MSSKKIFECSRLIAEKKIKIAFAESATAGWLASEFALAPHSGEIFLGGIVCYDVCTKQDLFDIPEDIIEKYTPESEEVTRLLAQRLKKYFKADITVGVTGLTSPGGSETPEKPVGTMFLFINGPNGVYRKHREVFKGNPKQIIAATIERSAELLIELLNNIS